MDDEDRLLERDHQFQAHRLWVRWGAWTFLGLSFLIASTCYTNPNRDVCREHYEDGYTAGMEAGLDSAAKLIKATHE